jgi:hypothetical protein
VHSKSDDGLVIFRVCFVRDVGAACSQSAECHQRRYVESELCRLLVHRMDLTIRIQKIVCQDGRTG